LAADGVTINTIRPDGSDVQLLLTVDKGPDEIVVDLSGEPSGPFLIYGVAPAKQTGWPRYFLVQNGAAAPLPSFRTVPRWSPDGRHFVAQMVGEADGPGPIYLYDTATGVGTTLAAAGVPDWYPDGSRLVYVAGDIWTFDLSSGAGMRLTELPAEGDEMWFVQEAHVLPGGEYIVFYGGQRKSVGASGNGQQWWWIPVSGGGPQPYAGRGGNMVLGYATGTAGDTLAYAESAHSSACISEQRIVARSPNPEGAVAVEAPIPATIERSSSAAFYIQGFSWEPDGHRIAYAVQQYHCVPGATELVTEPAVIYSWLVGQGFGVEGGAPRKLIEGAYPVWIR
ncbi:MAG TPA: hypothetical protein VLA19_26920, partial [Herpetosiphonaceae bacterium]|nr:hypothetical protein [Herpetosiphonaceae bacterium]